VSTALPVIRLPDGWQMADELAVVAASLEGPSGEAAASNSAATCNVNGLLRRKSFPILIEH
jgi:hypothetical protein